MAETSIPWGGQIALGDPGDAGPYNDDQWSDIWNSLFCRDRTVEAVVADYLNELEVTGVASPLSVATGLGLVDGKWYLNNSPLGVVVPTPAGATRIDRIVLRKNWLAQTVRVTRIAGAEGGGPPAITQTDGVTWDVPLAQISVTVLGVITVTDQRNFVGAPLASLFAPAMSTRTIAAGVISVIHKGFVRVDTEGAAASDLLDTINGGYEGQVIALGIVSASRTVQLTTAGNLAIGGPITITATSTLVLLRYDGTNWGAIGGVGGADILQVQVFS